MENIIIESNDYKVESISALIRAILDGEFITSDYGDKEIIYYNDEDKAILFNIKHPTCEYALLQRKYTADKLFDYLTEYWDKPENIGELYDDDGNLKHYTVTHFDF